MPSTCTICNTPLMGHPDADVTCGSCEVMNFAGDALRHPPRPPQTAHAAWNAPRRDGLRALRFVQGTWTWSEERGIEENERG